MLDYSSAPRRAALCILISRATCENVKTYLMRWLPLFTLPEQKGNIGIVVFGVIVVHSSVVDVVVVAGCYGEGGGW